MRESAERAAAREAVGRSIAEYARVWAEDRNADYDPEDPDDLRITRPVLDGWAVSVAISSTELAQASSTGKFAIVPHDQKVPMTAGLFWLQARDF